uniref:Putative GH23: Lytic transglycosylase n=1 Tax=Magnetococcus massalia (strain MO-1) TaxID=451514 RepID=A0A1S7LCD0_MAGMO|nr:putative GH23 : Lytic transglycosylase [Candidatus Magnetococcus massalia]
MAKLHAMIDRIAAEEGLDPDLLRAVAATESSFNNNAISKSGAIGLMQLMRPTAKDMGVKNIYDPEQNLRGGAKYLAMLLKRFDSLVLALSAYNAGPTNVDRHGTIPPFAQTQRYVQKVLTHYGKFRQLAKNSPSASRQPNVGNWDFALGDLAVLSREIERLGKLAAKAKRKAAAAEKRQTTAKLTAATAAPTRPEPQLASTRMLPQNKQATPVHWRRPQADPDPPSHYAAPPVNRAMDSHSPGVSLEDGLVTYQKVGRTKLSNRQLATPMRGMNRYEREKAQRAAIKRKQQVRKQATLKRRQALNARQAKLKKELAGRRARTAAIRKANRDRARALAIAAQKQAEAARLEARALMAESPEKRDTIPLRTHSNRIPVQAKIRNSAPDSPEGKGLTSYRKADGSLVFTNIKKSNSPIESTVTPLTTGANQIQGSRKMQSTPSGPQGRMLQSYQRTRRVPNLPTGREGIRIAGSNR